MKRFLYILGVIAVSLLLVLSMLVAVLMSDKVETAAVQLATEELSRALGTEMSVGAVEYHFPARLTLRDVYVEDQQHDTLAYLGEVYAHFRPLALQQNEISFSHVRVSNGVGKIYKLPVTENDSTQKWNFQFLADAFKSDKKQKDPLQSLVSVKDVQLDNMRFEVEDYSIRVPHAEMALNHLSADSLDAQISELSGEVLHPDKAPLVAQSVQAHMLVNATQLSFPTLTAQLPNSRLDLSGIDVHFPAGDSLSLSKSAHDISFNIGIHEATITPSELAFFVPALERFSKPVSLTGTLGGVLDSLYFNNIDVRYDGQAVLSGDVSAVGLPDLSNPYLRANLQDFQTNAGQLQDVLSRLQNKPIRLPKEAYRLGTIHYRGQAEGRLHDLTLHGAFRTAIGAISTDGTLRSDSTFENMDYDGRVVGRKLRVGRLIGHAPLQSVTVDVQSKGQVRDGKASGDVRAHLRELTYKDYTYEDIHINGRYEPKRYNGELSIDDKHLQLAFSGVVDVHDQNPEINFDLVCKHFDATPLGFKFLTDNLKTRFRVSADLDGINPDRMSGYLVVDSMFLGTARDSVIMRQMTLLVASGANKQKSFTLTSDYVTAEADGTFRYSDILPALQAMGHHYLPSAIAAPKKRFEDVNLSIDANGHRLRDLQRLFTAPVILSDHPVLTSDLFIPASQSHKEPSMSMRFYAPGVRAMSTPVHDLTVTLNTIDTLRHTALGGSGLSLNISAEAMKMHTVVSCLAFRDSVLTQLTLRQESDLDENLPEGWRNLSPRQLQYALRDLDRKERQHTLIAAQRAGTYGGNINLITHFSRYNQRPLIDMHIRPSTLLLRDSVYTISESRITYCAADTTINVDHFRFEGNGQHLIADGVCSPRASDTLDVDLLKIDASYVVPFFLPVQTIVFNGLLTGKAQLNSVMRKPHVETQIHIDSMGLNNCYFGEADVNLHVKDSLAFHADVMRPTRKVVDLNGKALFDGSGVWELDMMADSVPLKFINHWTSTVLTDLDGFGSGRVVVGGRKKMVYVLLRCAAQQGAFTLPWTGARYTIPSDTIVMDTTAILFPNVHLHDQEGHPVFVTGGVYHDQFADFHLDIHVDVDKALAFDVPDQAGQMLQGKVYASGHVDVVGDENDIQVIADARTESKSRFRLSIDNISSAYESNFIHFVSAKDSVIAIQAREETDLDNIDVVVMTAADSAAMYERAARCVLQLNLDVNPKLLFQLVLNERNGDMIQARGNGALRLKYDTETGDVQLLGTYDIDNGTLGYTVANMIRREFNVTPGSTISFSGDATNPQLDVVAQYKVTANLKDLFGNEIDQIGTTRTNIPVLACLHLTGRLNNPVLSFSLEFPLSDQAIQQQVLQVINTDEMLMRQVIYLLVFGRFFTPDYLDRAQYATLNSTYSLLSSTVTGQINSWLSKLTDMLTVGVAIRSDGTGATASQEYEAQFQLHPVDRLVINGNVGYRYNDIANQPFFGDLDVELLLTEDGQWRLKGYTHTVDKYSLRQASTMQGVSFMWKKDFNIPTKEQIRAKRAARKAKKEKKP